MSALLVEHREIIRQVSADHARKGMTLRESFLVAVRYASDVLGIHSSLVMDAARAGWYDGSKRG